MPRIYRSFSLILWLEPRNLVYLFREPHYLKMKHDIMKVLRETSDLEAPLGRRITWIISFALCPGWRTHHQIWKACPQLLWRHIASLNTEGPHCTRHFHFLRLHHARSRTPPRRGRRRLQCAGGAWARVPRRGLHGRRGCRGGRGAW